MFCPKCGVDLPDDSQFCRKCGRAQGHAVNVSTDAAAVAPARIPPPQPHGNTAKWVVGILIFLAVCWTLRQAELKFSQLRSVVAQSQSAVQQHSMSLPMTAFAVRQLGMSNYKFTVPAGAFDVSMKGHFTATGGARNDIVVGVVTEDEFVNWQNGHPTRALYNSGQVTQDTINLTLPADAGTYYIVFSNKFSFISPKAVQADVELTYSTR
jgi:hypothetical protein